MRDTLRILLLIKSRCMQSDKGYLPGFLHHGIATDLHHSPLTETDKTLPCPPIRDSKEVTAVSPRETLSLPQLSNNEDGRAGLSPSEHQQLPNARTACWQTGDAAWSDDDAIQSLAALYDQVCKLCHCRAWWLDGDPIIIWSRRLNFEVGKDSWDMSSLLSPGQWGEGRAWGSRRVLDSGQCSELQHGKGGAWGL